MPRIIVVGAGIGGLTAAIGLKRRGFEVQVYERAERIEPLGAGLTIQPNAMLALSGLGLADAVQAQGASLAAGALLRADGRALTESSFGPELIATVGAPIIGIHRATLHELLVRALGEGALSLGRACTGYEQVGDTVRVRFADGSVQSCDALVAADGLRSAVRAQLVGDGEPIYAGYTSWRGVTRDRCGLPPDFGGELWGRGLRFGGCCIDGGRFYWFAVANAPQGQQESSSDERKAALRERFSSFAPFVRALIESTPASAILRTDISDRKPLSCWGEGRVTLLGDAAHPMTPNLGQGACQAIEDALVLSLELSRAASLEQGLRAYEAARKSRANAVVTGARKLGVIGQWTNPWACALRDGLFGVMPPALMKKQLLDAWKLPASYQA